MSIPAPRWLAAALLPLLGLMSEYSGLDRAVLDAFYDTRAAGWRFGADWWSNEFLHEGGRALIKLLAAVLLLVALAGLRWRRARSWRRASFYLLVCIGIGTGLVNATKAGSNVDCPRSLERYAGEHRYVHVFADRPDDLPRSSRRGSSPSTSTAPSSTAAPGPDSRSPGVPQGSPYQAKPQPPAGEAGVSDAEFRPVQPKPGPRDNSSRFDD